MHNPARNLAEPHHDAEQLLPWFATGQLEGEDVALVEQHLSSCAHCRRQLAFERRMIDEFTQLTPEVDSGWARLKQRLEAAHESEPRQGVWDRIRGRAAEVWHGLSRPAIATLALAQLVLVVLTGAVLLSLSRPDYRALGSPPPPPAANAIAMVRADTTELQMRALLQANGATVVDGPTAADAYLLRVPAPSRAALLGPRRADRHVLLGPPLAGSRS